MNLDVIKPEKYEHLYLVYHSIIPLNGASNDIGYRVHH